MIKKRTLLKNLSIGGLVVFVGLPSLYVGELMIRNCSNRAMSRYSLSMLEGNGEEALKYAKRSVNLCKLIGLEETQDEVACALELMGNYDEALRVYRKAVTKDEYRLCELRVMVKNNRRSEAFDGYSQLIEEALKKIQHPDSRRSLGERVIRRITMENLYEKRLSPFAEYSDFLTFMEEEFKAQGNPAKYAEAMEFFRLIAADASDGDAGNKSVKAEESDVSDVPEPDGETSKTQAEATK